ncbi:cytochrome c oxidase accessory protein CcoG [Janthinobacterium sp. 17J80-10]|uniref:cytochrome c oxidase accessory protein CcoG n=1 Tax=Janthinobacterium sp. 17J80-10 TaxID=2497863 RepID=UPI0010056F75|nr:cytochrome c oxidase accessory protein CcoG [Janthinobacterium sp. 17J80-10]QAU34096.1 cytochrome c oxidase accessory protein CcoG [Janthinobacterium sp. 17J80-10]
METSPLKQYSQQEIEQSLYEVRKKIYPRALTGWFATWRWVLVWFTQIIFYGGPWLTWNDRQAVLFDLASRKFYIFGLVLWPQDFIYLAVLLVISALALFLFTAVGGRLFCGYACPQTVYTEIFMWVERKIEGERSARIRLDREPLSARKVTLKGAKHLVWGAIALWTGFTFVGYFTPIHLLAQELMQFALGPWETFWILFYGFATYGNAGWMREQVCKYMCPYARFQSAMFDKDTLTVTYDVTRGEPRGPRSKQVKPAEVGLGDCIDCGICVQVCPTGIDIREGLQYECIGCAACIDGCDQVMEKMNYPKGLIRYTTEHAMTNQLGKRDIWRRVFRTRTLVYFSILGAIVLTAATSLALRQPLKVDVIRDRGMPRVTDDGSVDNVYRLQMMNAEENPNRYVITVQGIDGATIISDSQIDVAAASTRAVPVRVRVPSGAAQPGSNRIKFIIQDTDNASVKITEKAVFLVPR